MTRTRWEVTLYFGAEGLEDNDEWVPGEPPEVMLPSLIRYALDDWGLYPEDIFVRRVGGDRKVAERAPDDEDTRGD